MSDRNLTEADVDAIVLKLKSQLMNDFQMSVGKGVLGWVWTWFWRLLLVAAVYGMARGQFMPDRPAVKLGAAIVPKPPAMFVVVPPSRTPPDLLAKADKLERMMAGERGK